MFRRGRKYYVIIALIVSIVLHIIMLTPIVLNMSWQEMFATLREKISQLIYPETPDQVLARKKAKSVPKISLNLDAETASNPNLAPHVITIRLIKDQPIAPKKQPLSSTVKKAPAKSVHSKHAQKPAEDLYTQLMSTPTPAQKTADEDRLLI
jgi:hypothetical protein